MQRVSTRASVATPSTCVAQCGRNFGRASERFVSERPRCGEQEIGRAVGPVTERVSTCHGAGHGIHGASHSDYGDEGRVLKPRRRLQTEQRLSPGRGGWTKSVYDELNLLCWLYVAPFLK
jgi:hypothetical protein